MALGDTNERIRLASPSWFDQVFDTGTEGTLVVGERLWSKILQRLDAMPLTRGCGLEFGVVGRASHNDSVLHGHKIVRGPDMFSKISVLIYIGPELSKPPTPPPVSDTHKMIAELFSWGLSCGLAVVGWVGTIGSAAGAGATFGTSALATIYFANAAALATAQCVGSTVHAGLMAWEAQDKADAMANNSAYKAFDRTADYTNFLAILSVGRKLVTVSRALREAGLTTSEAALAQMSEEEVVTMAKFLQLTKEEANLEGIANYVKSRILDAVMYGMGLYSSSRDGSGGAVQLRNLLLGTPPPAPPTPPVTARATPSVVAPKIVDYMLRYKPDEVANISILVLKRRG